MVLHESLACNFTRCGLLKLVVCAALPLAQMKDMIAPFARVFHKASVQ